MKNKYKVSEHNGQPAIFTDRGLVCLMEAGFQSTREKDAAEIVTILNAAPDLLAALKELCSDKYLADPINAERMKNARAALAKAEGVK